MKTNVQVIAPKAEEAQRIMRGVRRSRIIKDYVAAEKPYNVYAHTFLGGCVEFLPLEHNIVLRDAAEAIARNYARSWGKSENIKGVCVMQGGRVVYESEII